MTRKRVKLEEWMEAARNLYQEDGEIEIDDNAQLSPNEAAAPVVVEIRIFGIHA